MAFEKKMKLSQRRGRGRPKSDGSAPKKSKKANFGKWKTFVYKVLKQETLVFHRRHWFIQTLVFHRKL